MATAEEYFRQLQGLLPPGEAWPRDEDTTLGRLLRAMAVELARVDARSNDLIQEADPRTTTALLPEWERVTGLPDDCVGPGTTLQERRAMLVRKLTSIGGQSRAFFIDTAAALGFDISITEFRPFRVGRSAADDALCGHDWIFAWRVEGPETTIVHFRTGQSTVGEPLRSWGNTLLECVMTRLKPAHTIVQFAYPEAEEE